MTESSPDIEIVHLAQSWGWHNPPKSVLAMAREAREAQHSKSAQILVNMGVIKEEQKERWLASKPSSVQTIAWFAQQDASVAIYADRILTLKAGYPYYEMLSPLSIHPCMQDDIVAHRADEIDAAIMLVEDTLPVIVFSSFPALIKFRSLGRADRQRDAIVRAIGSVASDMQLAVGARDEIRTVLKAARSTSSASVSHETANTWNAASAENQSKPENREVTRLIDHALNQGATDVALKPFRNGEMQVQLRKYGELITPKSVPGRMSPDMARRVIALLQAKSGANRTNTAQRVPTDGQLTYRSGSGETYLRLSFIPMNHLGELRNLTSVSIRLLPRAEASISLDSLRLAESVIQQIQFSMRLSQGLVLVVGPTNSGKSTTVAGAIGEHVKLFGDRRKRLSVEDPIERYLYGIQQYNAPGHIKDETDRFEILLKGFKRHDPDMIWVGEVRDKVTADLCVASASSGHLVLSTLHANDSVVAFDVLAKMVDADKRFQLVESMALIISQRLVKELCPHCRTIGTPTAEEQQIFEQYLVTVGERAELPASIASANPTGCAYCDTGYTGLLPINDVLPFSRAAKDVAIDMLTGVNRRGVLAKARTLTLLQSGLDLLAQHRIDLDALLV